MHEVCILEEVRVAVHKGEEQQNGRHDPDQHVDQSATCETVKSERFTGVLMKGGGGGGEEAEQAEILFTNPVLQETRSHKSLLTTVDEKSA